MKILLIGLGRYGTEIAKRLLALNHELLIIESNVESIKKFLSLNLQGDYWICVGDATSHVVWEYLPLDELDLVISSLRSGEFNRAVCEILREILKNFDLPVVVYVNDHRYEDFFANYNCKTFYLPELAATFVEGLTLKGINKPIGIGLGKNEILEVVLSAKSPYADVPLNLTKHKHWRVALVYRGEKIILPRKKIKLKAGDRVILVGDNPKIVFEIAKSMALGTPQFPLSFGENLLVALKRRELHFLREHHYVWRHTRVKQVVLFTDADLSAVSRVVSDQKFLNENLQIVKGGYQSIFKREVQNEYAAGMISAPHKKRFFFFKPYSIKDFFRQEVPFLLPRLSFPYDRILVSLNNDNPTATLEICFELAQLLKAEKLDFLFVSLPEVLETEKEKRKFQQSQELVDYYAKLFDLKNRVSLIREVGNPVKKTLKYLSRYNLLVVSFVPGKVSTLEPYTPYLLAKQATKSVIGIPIVEG